jgi:hypothetical protein
VVDVIKFRTNPLHAAGNVLDIVGSLPFVTGHWIGKSKLHAGEYINVSFGTALQRYGTLIFLVDSDGVTRLHEIEANLPKLLFGHNGKGISGQEHLVLALSRLRWVASHFIAPGECSAVLPGLGRGGHITRIEIGLQLWDYQKILLLASHLTSGKYFRKAPMIAAGESTTHTTGELSLKFYDKRLQLKDGMVVPPAACCTRIEAQFRSSARLRKAANDNVPKAYGKIATVAFDWLFEVFRKTFCATLIGTLAKASFKGPRGLRSESLRILELGEAILTHSALAEHEIARGSHEGSRIKNEVFGELSRLFPGSLEEMLENGYPRHRLAEVEIPARQRAHLRMMERQGWPMSSYPEVEGVFSRTIYLDDQHEPRHFVLHPERS